MLSALKCQWSQWDLKFLTALSTGIRTEANHSPPVPARKALQSSLTFCVWGVLLKLAPGMLLGWCPEVQLIPPSSDEIRAAPWPWEFKIWWRRDENEKVPCPGAFLPLRAEPRVPQSRSEPYLLGLGWRRTGAPPHSKGSPCTSPSPAWGLWLQEVQRQRNIFKYLPALLLMSNYTDVLGWISTE